MIDTTLEIWSGNIYLFDAHNQKTSTLLSVAMMSKFSLSSWDPRNDIYDQNVTFLGCIIIYALIENPVPNCMHFFELYSQHDFLTIQHFTNQLCVLVLLII